MTRQEIVRALRCCAKGLGHDDACENCKVGEIQNRRECIEFAAANAIERLTDVNATLRKEIEWKDMVIALAQRKQAKAEAERDALIEQIKERHDCLDCKHNDSCEYDGVIVKSASIFLRAPDNAASRWHSVAPLAVSATRRLKAVWRIMSGHWMEPKEKFQIASASWPRPTRTGGASCCHARWVIQCGE